MNNTEEFYCFYKEKMVFKDAKPNMAHKALAALEASGHLLGVITQNIDGLHQAAGVKMFLNCTAVFIEITAPSATDFFHWIIF